MKTKAYREATQTQDYVTRLKDELIKRKQNQVSLGLGNSLAHKDAGEQLKNTQSRLSAAMAEGEVVPFPKRLEKKEPSGKPAAVHTFRSKDTKRNMQAKVRLKKLANEETEMTISESVKQIVDLTVSGEPASVKTAVETAIGEKIATALEAKKIQIAQSLIGLGESSDEEEPSWSHKGEKTERAKRLAMNKIKKQAKNEGVELSDEDAELILEAVITGNNSKVAEATTEHVRPWFTEEELGVFGCNDRKGSSASNEKTNAFGSEHKGTSGIPSELKRSGKDIMSQSKKKVSEDNQPTNGGPSLGLTASPNRTTAPKSKFPTKAQSTPNKKDAMQYDAGNKKPGDIMSKTEAVEALQQSFLEELKVELTDEEAGLILEAIINNDKLDEASPPGWQHVVKKLLTKKDSKVNPWAIAWSMKNKGYHAHPENQISRKSYDRWYQKTGKGLAHAGA